VAVCVALIECSIVINRVSVVLLCAMALLTCPKICSTWFRNLGRNQISALEDGTFEDLVSVSGLFVNW
jgi:hypothetical protein